MCGLRLKLVVCCFALFAGGCSSALHWQGSAAADDEHAKAAGIARQMVGAPYKWGGATPQGFDCSGLVQYSYSKAGLSVPRTSRAQYSASRRINLRDARAGDLLFFNFDRSISHVGIYLGDGRFVHAPSSGKRVQVTSLNQAPYNNHFVAAGRIQ